MGNTWKAEILRTILNMFSPYDRIDVLKLSFLEELYEKTFVVPYVDLIQWQKMQEYVVTNYQSAYQRNVIAH